MPSEHRSPHWNEIVGDNWPAIGPEQWNALEALARTASRAMNADDAAQARVGFDERVRSSARLLTVKEQMLAQQSDPQAFSDALAATADVLRSYSDVVYRTRNQILDIVERADRAIRAERKADSDSDDEESAADRQAERAERIAAVIEDARADVDDTAAAAVTSVSPVALPELAAIADHLGQPGPLAPAAPGAPRRPTTPAGTPAPTDLVVDAAPAPDAAGPAAEPWNPYARAPRAAFPMQPSGGGALDAPGPTSDQDRAADDRAGRPPWHDRPESGARPATGPPPAASIPAALPVDSWQEPPGDPGSTGTAGASVGRSAPVTATTSTEPDDDESRPETESSTGADPGVDPSGDEARAIAASTAPGPGPPRLGDSLVPGQVLPPAVTDSPPAPVLVPPVSTAAASAPPTPAPAHPAGAAPRSGTSVFAPNTSLPQPVSPSGPPNRTDARPDRPVPPATRDDDSIDRDEPQRAEEVVRAAMIAAAAPSFLLGDRVDGDLVLAQTLLAGVLAAVGPTVLGLDWAVATMRGPGGLSAFLTSNEGRGWLPAGVFLPEAVSLPWLWAESERAGAAWEGIADPARVLVEFGLVWSRRSGAGLTALASSRSIGPELRARLREVPMADTVEASHRWDLRAAAPGLVDRLGVTGAPELSRRADGTPGHDVYARCAGLAWDAHTKVSGIGVPGTEAAMARAARDRVLTMMRRGTPVPPELWEELRDTDDLLSAAMLSRRVDASRVDLGELKVDPEATALRTMVFERRCDELVLLLADAGEPPTEPFARQLMRDAVYAHAQVVGHPRFVADASAGPEYPGGRSSAITVGRR